MEQLYRQFIREKQYLHNVSPCTVEGYDWAWQAFEPAMSGRSYIAKADILQRIEELRARGLSLVSINTYPPIQCAVYEADLIDELRSKKLGYLVAIADPAE